MSFQFISYFSSQNCQVLRALIWLTGFVLEMQKSTTFPPWGQSGSTPTATRNLFSSFFWQLLPWKDNSEKVLRVRRTTGQQIKLLLTHWKTVRLFSCQVPFIQVIHLDHDERQSLDVVGEVFLVILNGLKGAIETSQKMTTFANEVHWPKLSQLSKWAFIWKTAMFGMLPP